MFELLNMDNMDYENNKKYNTYFMVDELAVGCFAHNNNEKFYFDEFAPQGHLFEEYGIIL